MWHKEEEKSQGSTTVSAPSVNAPTPASTTPLSRTVSAKAPACVSQGIRIKGEVTGTEDLFVDGQFEGTLMLANSIVTIGPNAFVKAEITGRELIIRGRVEGKLSGSDRVQIWHTARVNGEVKTEKISIEEGAELHGKLEAGKAPAGASESAAAGGLKKDLKGKEAGAAEKKAPSGAAIAGAS